MKSVELPAGSRFWGRWRKTLPAFIPAFSPGEKVARPPVIHAADFFNIRSDYGTGLGICTLVANTKCHIGTADRFHGISNLKKAADWLALIGREFEKAPVPSSVPVLFVVHCTGGARLVVASQV